MTKGFTLVELLVVLALLGVTTLLAAAAWAPQTGQPVGSDLPSILRRKAIQTGKPASDTVTYQGKVLTIRAFPDGRVAGAAALGIDPISGRPNR